MSFAMDEKNVLSFSFTKDKIYKLDIPAEDVARVNKMTEQFATKNTAPLFDYLRASNNLDNLYFGRDLAHAISLKSDSTAFQDAIDVLLEHERFYPKNEAHMAASSSPTLTIPGTPARETGISFSVANTPLSIRNHSTEHDDSTAREPSTPFSEFNAAQWAEYDAVISRKARAESATAFLGSPTASAAFNLVPGSKL